jgi:hypothetical protein
MSDGPHPGHDEQGRFEPGHAESTKHGARSEAQIRPVARAQRRRFLRQMGLRASDLEGLGLALLDNWARAQAKVVLLDAYFDRAGFLDEEGEPVPATRIYFTALNTARLALVRLDDHLKARDPGGQSLADVIAEYGNQNKEERNA